MLGKHSATESYPGSDKVVCTHIFMAYSSQEVIVPIKSSTCGRDSTKPKLQALVVTGSRDCCRPEPNYLGMFLVLLKAILSLGPTQ